MKELQKESGKLFLFYGKVGHLIVPVLSAKNCIAGISSFQTAGQSVLPATSSTRFPHIHVPGTLITCYGFWGCDGWIVVDKSSHTAPAPLSHTKPERKRDDTMNSDYIGDGNDCVV